MLNPCPLPSGRAKAAFSQDESNTIKARTAAVMKERKMAIDYVKMLDTPETVKMLTDAENAVVTAQNATNKLRTRIENLVLNDKSVTANLVSRRKVVTAEEVAVKASKKVEQNIQTSIDKLDTAFNKANSDVDPSLIKSYENLFYLAKKTTDPDALKKIDSALVQMEKALEKEAKGVAGELKKLYKTRDGLVSQQNKQVLTTTKAQQRVVKAEKQWGEAAAKVDKQLSSDYTKAQAELDGAQFKLDMTRDVQNRYEAQRRSNVDDLAQTRLNRDAYHANLTEAIDLDPRQGRGVMDWAVSKFGITMELIKSMSPAIKVRLGLQRAGTIAENAVNKISDVVEIKKLIDFRTEFTKAADALGIAPNQRRVLMVDTIEKGQIPNFLEYFDPDNFAVRHVQEARYQQYQTQMIRAGFTQPQIDQLINQAVDVSRISDDIRKMSVAFGVDIDKMEPFLGYITRIFNMDGKIWRRRIIEAEAKQGSVLPVGKDAKFKFDIARKYDYLVPTDLDLASEIMQVAPPDLMALIDNPLQMQLFVEANLSVAQIDTLLNLGFFQKLPMSTSEVFDYLKTQYQLPFNSAADMFELDPVVLMQSYSRAIGDQANISMMLTGILAEDGVRLGWSIPKGVYENDALLPVGQRKYANYVKMEDKMLEWTSRLGITAETQSALGDILMNPVVADQVVAILDITKSPALLGQLGGAIGAINTFYSKLKGGNLVANAPVYLANQVRGNYHQMHAAGANVLLYMPTFNDVRRVVSGEGLDHLDNTIKKYEIDGKQLTERELFLDHVYQEHGTSSTAIFGERGKPSSFNPKDAAREMLGNSSSSMYQLMMYMFGSGELTGGKALNSMERVLGGVDYFMQKSGAVIDGLSAPVFYTANMIDFAAKYTTLRSVVKRIDGADTFDKGMTYMFSQSMKQFDTTETLNKHIRNYFPDMRDVGSATYAVDKYAIMYFSWQASMMPRVLRDVVRRPWRYAAYEKLRQFTAEPLREDDSITEAGISPDILKGMPYYIGRGRDDNKLVFWNDASYNPTTSTFEFLRETLNMNETVADRRAKLQGDARNATLVRALQSTYAPAKILYELASNTNLRTGKALRSGENAIPLLGFKVPPELYSLINNAVPYAGALDRLDLEWLSGSPEIRDNNGEIIQQGKRGLGGAVPDATGRMLRSKEVESDWAYRIMGTIGGNLRVIDMVKQNKITYNDVSRSLDVVTKQLDREKESLLSDTRAGSIKNTKSYTERVQNMEKLLITRTQLQIDEDRIYLYLRERGTLTDKEIKQKEMYLNQIQQMGVSPIDAAIQNQAQQLMKFRQEWSIPQYGKGKTSP